MYFILKSYRALLDARFMPEYIRVFMERVAVRLSRGITHAIADRQRVYQISPIPGLRLKLALDWLDATDIRFVIQRAYEKGNLRAISERMRPGDLFLDIGANIGYFALSIALLQPLGDVIAIEPVRRNVRAVRKGVELNDLSNVVICHAAVGREAGMASIRHRFLNSGSPSIVNYFGNRPVVDEYMLNEDVQVRTIADILVEHSQSSCRMIKMDVQGAELAALNGAEIFLKSGSIDFLLIEHNGGVYGEGVRSYLASFGYYPHSIHEDGSCERVGEDMGLRNKRDYLYSRSS